MVAFQSSETAAQRDKWVKILHESMAWHSRRSSSSRSSTGSSLLRASWWVSLVIHEIIHQYHPYYMYVWRIACAVGYLVKFSIFTTVAEMDYPFTTHFFPSHRAFVHSHRSFLPFTSHFFALHITLFYPSLRTLRPFTVVGIR